MVLKILFIITILILGLFVFFRIRNNRSQTLLRKSTLSMARQKLEELSRTGEKIRYLQNSNHHLQQNSNHMSSVRPLNPPVISQGARGNEVLPPKELIDLREKAINILVGKYRLEPEVQDYLSRKLDGMFGKMIASSSGNSLQSKLHTIQSRYDPTYSNDLLLHSSRFLMNCENLSPSVRLLVAQFIVNTTTNGEELERIYDWIIELGSDPEASQQVRQEAVDMLILSNSTRYREVANQILESLRRIDDDQPVQVAEIEDHFPFNNPVPQPRQAQQTQPRRVPPRRTVRLGGIDYDLRTQRNLLAEFQRAKPKVERTVYQDGQSVHNNEINKSVLQAAKSLQTEYPMKTRLSFDTSLLNDLTPSQRQKAEAALHRIATDDSTFGENITLFNLFQSLQAFILSSPSKDELNKRLIQELGDMSGTCASGHLSRLVNVVQGFNAIPQQAIRINLGDEIYAKVNHTLTQALSKPENQEVADAVIMGENPKLTNHFVAQQVNKLFPEMKKEYEGTSKDAEILKELLSAAKKYTKHEHFTIRENEIVTR
jgi:hypothetical protein